MKKLFGYILVLLVLLVGAEQFCIAGDSTPSSLPASRPTAVPQTKQVKKKRTEMRELSAYAKWKAKNIPLYAEYETKPGKNNKPVAVRRNGRKVRTTRSFIFYKVWMLAELSVFIAAGIFLAQVLEVSGAINYLAVLTWPLTRLGRINKEAGPAFLMAFQSGAVANSMLVSSRADGSIDGRQLYTSVLVVSCLSLFAHLPTYIGPLAGATNWNVSVAMFSVRFAAIFLEIAVVLLISNLIIRPVLARRAAKALPDEISIEQLESADQVRQRVEKRLVKASNVSFWKRVWNRSHKTLRRILIFLLPSYAIVSGLEIAGAFDWLRHAMPGLFTLNFLPAESAAIIPAQAASLSNGAAVAGDYLQEGILTDQQVVFILLIGSMITAPVRTLKHALPTYVAILGPKAGLIMAISAQVIRVLFLLGCTIALWMIW